MSCCNPCGHCTPRIIDTSVKTSPVEVVDVPTPEPTVELCTKTVYTVDMEGQLVPEIILVPCSEVNNVL